MEFKYPTKEENERLKAELRLLDTSSPMCGYYQILENALDIPEQKLLDCLSYHVPLGELYDRDAIDFNMNKERWQQKSVGLTNWLLGFMDGFDDRDTFFPISILLLEGYIEVVLYIYSSANNLDGSVYDFIGVDIAKLKKLKQKTFEYYCGDPNRNAFFESMLFEHRFILNKLKKFSE